MSQSLVQFAADQVEKDRERVHGRQRRRFTIAITDTNRSVGAGFVYQSRSGSSFLRTHQWSSNTKVTELHVYTFTCRFRQQDIFRFDIAMNNSCWVYIDRRRQYLADNLCCLRFRVRGNIMIPSLTSCISSVISKTSSRSITCCWSLS